MYKVELNTTGSWIVTTNVDISQAQVSRAFVDDSIRVRDGITGHFIFYGTTCSALKAQLDAGVNQVGLRLYFGAVLLVQVYLNTDGEYARDSLTCKLTCEYDDRYNAIYRYLARDIERSFQPLHTMGTQADEYVTYQNQSTDQDVSHDAIESAQWTYCELGSINDYGVWNPAITYKPGKELPNDRNDGVRYFQTWDGGENQCRSQVTPQLKYVCIQECKGIDPDFDLEEKYWVRLQGRVLKMGCVFARLKLANTIYDEDYLRWGKAGCSGLAAAGVEYQAINITTMLQTFLAEADPTINLAADYLEPWPDFLLNRDLVLYYINEENSYKWTLDKVIQVIETAYQVSWRLEGQDFYFRKWSDIQTTQGTGQYYDFTNIFNRDWSHEVFNFAIDKKVWRHKFIIGQLTIEQIEQPDFAPITLDFETQYQEMAETENSNFDTDLEGVQRFNEEDYAVLCLIDKSGGLQNTIGIESGLLVYNGEMACYNLVQDNYFDNREFAAARFYPYNNPGDPVALDVTLETARAHDNTVQLTYNSQHLIDFDYLINTRFGLCGPRELVINLGAGISTFKLVQ